MSHRSFLIGITFVVLLCSFSVRSQEPGPKARQNENVSSDLKKKALDSLHTIAARVNTLRSPENRARIRSNLGDLLWEDDEKSSRSLFAAVGDDINEGFTNIEPDPEAGVHAILVFRQLRSDTLDRIARHDPELALDFLRATRPPAAARLPYEAEDTEKVLELRLAGQIAAKRPELALKLGRESLARGFSIDLLLVLAQLRNTDRASASSFFKDIIDKLKGAKLAEDWQATEVALSMVRDFQPPQIEDSVYKDLIAILLSTALANGCAKASADDEDGPQICYQIGSVFSKLDKYYGPQAAPLKRWAGGIEEDSAPSRPELWAHVIKVAEQGSIDEIRELASQNPDAQLQIYALAIRRMVVSADFVRARQLASDFPDVDGRRELLAQIAADEQRNADDPASGQRGRPSFRNSEQHLDYLFRTASKSVASDPKAALRLLDEAGPLIDSLKGGNAKLQAQIVWAMLYCWLKNERGFAIMESLMPKLNELVSAAAALDGYETNYLSDGEWNMSGEGSVGGLLTVLANNSAFFARLDFDRSVALANQLERPELQMMAQLKIAQSVLSNQPLQLPPFPNRVP